MSIADRLAILERNEGWLGRTLLRIGGLRYPRRTRSARTDVPVTKEELAALVNVSRSTLRQTLRRLENQGLAAQSYRAVRILDLLKLESLATGSWLSSRVSPESNGSVGNRPCTSGSAALPGIGSLSAFPFVVIPRVVGSCDEGKTTAHGQLRTASRATRLVAVSWLLSP